MLEIVRTIKELNIRHLLDVYSDSLDEVARNKGEALPYGLRMLEAEQDFLGYMRDFLSFPGAFLALWTHDSLCVSALRVEPYDDGYLISGLETKTEQRKMGYGKKLLREVVQNLDHAVKCRIYSHVSKRNTASLHLHLSCGFFVVSDYAVLLDGSVFTDYYTLRYDPHR